MQIEIREVVDYRGLKAFIRFPHTLYRGHACWVPSLDADEWNTLHWKKNPAMDHCEVRYFMAYRGGRAVGRIAGILNRLHMETWKEPYARFGWFDFIDDPAVSQALLSAVEAWAKARGLTAVHGPLGFTDMDREGMLIEGFGELSTLATLYNPPYYPQHLALHGYVKDIDWIEYEMAVPATPNESIARVADIARRRFKLTLLRPKNKKDLLAHARELFVLLNQAYAHLYGFVPLTDAQMNAYVKQYFSFIKPEFVPMLLDADGRLAAFGVTMPSLSKALQRSHGRLFPFGVFHLLWAMRKNDRADLYLVAVRPEFQGKGVNAILINEMNQVYNRLGITKVESNPELETNTQVQSQWKYFDKRQHRRRRCFIRRFGEPEDSAT